MRVHIEMFVFSEYLRNRIVFMLIGRRINKLLEF